MDFYSIILLGGSIGLAYLSLVLFVSLGKPIRFPTVVQGVIIYESPPLMQRRTRAIKSFPVVVCRHPTISLDPTRHPLLTADWRFSRTFFFVTDRVVLRLFFDIFP